MNTSLIFAYLDRKRIPEGKTARKGRQPALNTSEGTTKSRIQIRASCGERVRLRHMGTSGVLERHFH
jgi:hypothetical protein